MVKIFNLIPFGSQFKSEILEIFKKIETQKYIQIFELYKVYISLFIAETTEEAILFIQEIRRYINILELYVIETNDQDVCAFVEELTSSIIMNQLNGFEDRFIKENNEKLENIIIGTTCATCHINVNDTEKKKLLRCSGCKLIKYCTKECQVQDWKNHKKNCIENI